MDLISNLLAYLAPGAFLISIAFGNPARLFMDGEWFVGTAVLTAVRFFFLRAGAYGGPMLSLRLVTAALLAFAFGFTLPPGRHLVPMGGTDAPRNSRLVTRRPAQARIPERENATWLGAFLGTVWETRAEFVAADGD
jgi:hypothetical protein